MAMACLSIFLFGSRLEKKELAGILKEQGDSAGHLLEEVEARYRGARLVQEIGQAGADIPYEHTFLETVLASMTRNLDFTRGLIALCNEDRSRLFYVDSYGFSPAELRFLEDLDVPIKVSDASDIFIRSMNTGKPVYVNDIRQLFDEMTPNSLAIIEELSVDSLICVPLIHKRKPLGLLFVDARGSARNHTASDVNLLTGIASQVATGIVNARSYQQIQQSEKRYRLLAENVMDVIWIMDAQTFAMKYISPSVEKVTGYTPEEIMAMTIDQHLTPDAFQRAVSTVDEAMEGVMAGTIDPENYSMTLELEEVHKNGSLIPVEVTAGFMAEENGSPRAVLGISRDLSERKKTEQDRAQIENKLQQARKMESLGTVAGSIAHNFNNLLMVVLGNLELAKEELPDPSPSVKNIQRAINASQRAADLSGMMLTYVGQLKKESSPVDLSHTVNAVLKNMDETNMANVELDLDLADPMPLVIADAGQMRQMISGFITNAIEALEKEKGRVRISTGSMHCDRDYLATTYLEEEMPEGMYAYVEVADTGCGMNAETLGNVFDPFFSTKFTGRGLGMAAVMGIIRSHSGAVRVSSVKNEGSVFTALFPIQGISTRPSAPESTGVTPVLGDKTVMIVDDDAMVLDIGSQFLKRLGFRVKKAACGREALEMLKKDPDHVDCLLLDFTLPGMNGLETMQQVRIIRPDAKIIISSGYTRKDIEDRFAHIDPPDGFIHKPFQMKALQKTLRTVIKDAG
jgi:PAS domain S-box-containing protein